MAGPIKIAIVADAGRATADVSKFAGAVEGNVTRAAGSMDRLGTSSRRAGQDAADGFDRAGRAADDVDTKAMGFRDTMTGVEDSMKGAALIAKGDLFTGFLTLGMGVGDLASGLFNFLLPGVKAAVTAMRALNLTMLTNPVFLVIAAIVALVAIFVIAYKKSETFRRIVDGAFKGVLNAARGAWNWVKGNWPLLLAIITGPIGLAVRWVVQNFDKIKAKVKGIPGAIRNVFSNAGSLLKGAGRRIVEGLWSGITGLTGWLAGKVRGFIENTVPGPIRRALGMASPSKLARKLGGYFGQGLGLGLDDTEQLVRRSAGRLAAATIPALPAGPGATAGSVGGGRAVVELPDSEVGRFLLRMLREAIRVQGRGDVLLALGTG